MADGAARLGRAAAGTGVAVAAPGLVTLLALGHVAPVVPALLYVVAIGVAAAVGGAVVGLLAVVTSFVPYTYFFTPPRHTFSVADATDAVALGVFVVVAVGMSQLFARVRHIRERERQARSRAEAEAARTVRLEAVARALAHAGTPQDVLDVVVTEGLAAADARAGLIATLSADGSTLEVAAERGYGAGRVDGWRRFGVDEDLPLSDAVRTGQAVYLASTAERNRRYPRLASLPERSHALTALPLVFEGRPIGGLVLSFRGDEKFDLDRRALKEALAAQVAQALERTRLDEAERDLRERLGFLAEAGEVLASSLDYETTLRRLTDLTVPRLADWCAIDMLSEDEGAIERVAIAHRDEEKLRLAQELARRYPVNREAPGGVAAVLRTGEPSFTPEVDDAQLVAAAQGDEEWLAIVRRLGLTSSMLVPLVVRERTVGVLSLLAAERARRFTRSDLDLALELARRAAVAVDNTRLYAEAGRRADAARALQHVVDAVVLVGTDGEPRYWNAAAAALLPDEGGELGWQPLARAIDGRGAPEREPLTLPVELDGRERWLQVTRVGFEEGRVYVLRDVTEERLLERTRSEFVATASHELRTPIAAVYGTFQTLSREDVDIGSERARAFLRIGLQESERLTRIVDDLLLTGQLDGGSPRIEATTCDVGAVIDDVLVATSSRLNGSHTLAAAVTRPLATARCDPMRLRQVLANLVENAIKYSPDGGTVTVGATRSGSGTVRIEIADEGIGIPEADQARIFERFVRLDPALHRGVGGTGLGLYICRELVERMGGRIGVRSRVGEGSTFVVDLPAQ